MKVETPSNGSGPGTPTKPVSEPSPEWSTNWPPAGETPAPTTPISEQARVPSQGYEAYESPARYAPTATTTPEAPYTTAPTPAPTYAPTYATAPRDRDKESSGLIWPILLIAAGTILLLNTLGVLSWAVWNGIWRLWPLALVFIGLELLFGRRSRVASYVIAALLVLTIAGLAVSWSVLPWTGGGAVNRQSISQPLSGATSADVQISLGLGDLTVGPLDNPGDMIAQGTIELAGNDRLERNYTVNDGVGLLTLANTGVNWNWFGGSVGPRTHTINLNPTIPMSLKVDGGVGDTRLNLADFNMRRLEVNSGVGKVEATLPAVGTSDAFIHGGVGEVILNVPEGTGLRVHATQGLGSNNFPSSYAHDGEVWTSPGYDSAANRINMEVTGGVGSLTVREAGR